MYSSFKRERFKPWATKRRERENLLWNKKCRVLVMRLIFSSVVCGSVKMDIAGVRKGGGHLILLQCWFHDALSNMSVCMCYTCSKKHSYLIELCCTRAKRRTETWGEIWMINGADGSSDKKQHPTLQPPTSVKTIYPHTHTHDRGCVSNWDTARSCSSHMRFGVVC